MTQPPLRGRAVIVCRAADDAGPTIERLADLGATAIAVPLQAVADPADGGASLSTAAADLGRYRWLAVTSANGARALLAALPPTSAARQRSAPDAPTTGASAGPLHGGAGAPGDERGREAAGAAHIGPGAAGGAGAPGDERGRGAAGAAHIGPGAAGGAGQHGVAAGVRVAAIGPATAAVFERAGVAVDLMPERATAADLAAAFPEPSAPGERVLAPLGEAADDALTAGLAAKGYEVDRVDAYRMVAVATDPDRASDEATWADVAVADAVLFTAPSIVDRFIERFTLDAVPPVVVCIGPRTLARTAECGIDGAIEADVHSLDGLIDALLGSLRPRGDG